MTVKAKSPSRNPSRSRTPRGTAVERPYKAYERVRPDYAGREAEVAAAFDRLLAAARAAESPLLRELKPGIALAIKWRFDWLAKTYAAPFDIEADLRYWLETVRTLDALGRLGWFPMAGGAECPDVWKRTAHGFDLGWTTTTKEERFEASRRIAEDRTAQLVEMLGGPGFFKGKAILDSGCGPGRYIDILRGYGPARIVGLDQGERLVAALKERFAGDPVVAIERGTCEKLRHPDSSFDVVLSNGVLHHTPSDIRTMLRDHARVLKRGGVMFIMLVGKGGLELKLWEFVRGLLYDVPIEAMLERLGPLVSPLRLQGVVDHMYGEYQQTDRPEFEAWCKELFRELRRVPGVAGLDVTPEIYADDPWFAPRFGTGHLRYLCFK